MPRKYIDPITVNRLLRYDPDTGHFYWRVFSSPTAPQGSRAGSVLNDGYVQISIRGVAYLAHRLAWAVSNNGLSPEFEIDHKDHNRANNRLDNLRLATRELNAQNIALPKRNTTGHIGVYYRPRERAWQACITRYGKRHYLGTFKLKQHAIAARAEAERRLHVEYPHTPRST